GLQPPDVQAWAFAAETRTGEVLACQPLGLPEGGASTLPNARQRPFDAGADAPLIPPAPTLEFARRRDYVHLVAECSKKEVNAMQAMEAPAVARQMDTLVDAEAITKVIGSDGTSTTILEGVSFTVPYRSLFAINGPSGSGKSTLLNILTGIDRPTSGRVVFAGQEIRQMSENQLARWRGHNVGIVFQFFQLLPTLTARENVELALELGAAIPKRERGRRAHACLERVGMANYANRMPSQLSGGQQQRVAIARALANDPPVLVADEPTGNLDSRTAHQIFDLMQELTEQGKSVLYVTHDRDFAARATGRVDLLDGRVVGGTTATQTAEKRGCA